MVKPTMADIARRAGVTVATVSRALAQPTTAPLREETIARVLAVAAELGYRPNTLARGLRTQRTFTLGMLAPDLTNPFMPPVVRAVQDVLAGAGYALIVANTDNEPEREARAIRTMVDHQVDGLLLATARLDEGWSAAPPSLPVVLVNRRSRHPLPTVVPDDAQGVEDVVAHLTALGHRRIGHVAGPSGISTGRARAEAFAGAMAARGSHRPDASEATERLTVADGHAACARLLARRTDLTAIFAANDLVAIGCLNALRERGLRVPHDISLVGFNDMELVDLIDPPLTTVRISQPDLGQRAAELMLQILDPDTPPDRSPGGTPPLVALATQLVVRGSTAPPTR